MTENTSVRASGMEDRGAAFRRLHDDDIFVMPCAWDPISALLFERAGFGVLARPAVA